MGILRNDGDIILDMVLTDAGRQRLAKGDGSFRIVKFALSDSEIDYRNYNLNDSRGSAYFDINILSTPCFQAFTNNTAAMKYKLVSYARNDLLYLPVIKLSTTLGPGGGTYNSAGYYIVTANDETIKSLGIGTGIVDGQTAETAQRSPITFEQGLDTTELSARVQIPNDLKETQYFVKIDSRLGEIITPRGTAKQAEVSFIDDDKYAMYIFSVGTPGDFIRDITNVDGNSAIAGPRGTMFQFSIRANISLGTSDYLFNKIGSSITISAVNYKYIDTYVMIEGGTTGFSIELPIRFLRKV
jgi:hypothetical protein